MAEPTGPGPDIRSVGDEPSDGAGAPAPVPEFEVVIRTWNDHERLVRAVSSARVVPGVSRVVVVDDGSEPAVDSSTLIAGDGRLPEVVVHRQANAGAPAARNTGIGFARTEWVVLLDSDDELLPGAADAVALGAARGASAVVSGRIFVWPDGREEPVLPPREWDRLPSPHHAFEHLRAIFSPTGQAVRRDAGERAGAACDVAINQAEDLQFVYELARTGEVVMHHGPSARYTVHPKDGGNMTATHRLDSHVRDVLALCRRIHGPGVGPEADAIWRAFVLDYTLRYARHGRDGGLWREILAECASRGWRVPTKIRFKRWWRGLKRRKGR